MSTRPEFARSLIESPEFIGLIEELRNEQFTIIEQSPYEAVKPREAAYSMLRALGQLYSRLETVADTGAHEKGRETTHRMMG